jgi:flagellar protein FlaJ
MAYPAAVATRASRERKALENSLPDFIRDISEGRKIGLSPEATVQGLASKNYGILSRHVRKMSSQLSWGVSLRQVISTFVTGVQSWVTREVGMLLMEVVDVGGGTVRSFTDMADFTRRINDLESERKSSLRPYLFILYFSSIMVVVTTLIMVYFVSTPLNLSVAGRAAQASKVDLGTTNILLTIAAVESFVIGVVAGKMGEGSSADGFKHALILVVIGLISVYAAQAVLGIEIQ